MIDIKDSAAFLTLMKHAQKNNMLACGHMLYNISLECLLEHGYSTIEHVGGFEEAAAKGRSYLNNNNSPGKEKRYLPMSTLDWYRVYYHLITDAELQKRYGLQYVPDSVVQDWNKELQATKRKQGDSLYNAIATKYRKTDAQKLAIIKDMADNNIGLLLGADGGDTYEVPGFTLVEEMKAFKQAGISNYKILQCATLSAARYMKQDKQWGTIERGKNANLVLLNANPLEDITAVSNVNGIVLNNKFYTQEALHAFLN